MTATIFKRASAAFTDILIIQISVLLLTTSLSENHLPSPGGEPLVDIFENLGILLYFASLKLTLFFSLSAFYVTMFTSLGGQTPGKRIFRIKVIKEHGDKISPVCAAMRFFALILSLVTVFGLLSIIFDRRGQGWHDKWSGTFVVSTESETINGL